MENPTINSVSIPANTADTTTITINGTGGTGMTWPNYTQPVFIPNVQPNIQLLPNMPNYAIQWMGKEEIKALIKESLMEMFAQFLVPAEIE